MEITPAEVAVINAAQKRAQKAGVPQTIRLGGHEVLVDAAGHVIDLTTGRGYKAPPYVAPKTPQQPTRPAAEREAVQLYPNGGYNGTRGTIEVHNLNKDAPITLILPNGMGGSSIGYCETIQVPPGYGWKGRGATVVGY